MRRMQFLCLKTPQLRVVAGLVCFEVSRCESEVLAALFTLSSAKNIAEKKLTVVG